MVESHLRKIILKGIVFLMVCAFTLCVINVKAYAEINIPEIEIKMEYYSLRLPGFSNFTKMKELLKEMYEEKIEKELCMKKLEIVSNVPEKEKMEHELCEKKLEIISKVSEQEKMEMELCEKKLEVRSKFPEGEKIELFINKKETIRKVVEQERNLTEFQFEEILENSIIPLTEDEYYELCYMVFCESGFCSWEMNNACASTAISQAIQQGKTIGEILNIPGRFRNGNYTFRDYKPDGSYIVREVEISDLTLQIYDAVNQALLGYDVTSETNGGSIGFWAPNVCSDERNEYMYNHTRGLCQIENVTFFHEWVN